MNNYSKIVATLATIIAVCALIIGAVAISSAYNVTSDHIVDGTIQARDLSDNIPVALTFSDGGSINAFIGKEQNYPENNIDIPFNYIKVRAIGGSLVIDPNDMHVTSAMINDGAVGASALAANSITSDKISDGSIELRDLDFNTLSSINGIISNGGNVDLVGSNTIVVTTDKTNHKIVLSVNTSAINNAALLNGQDSLYYTNASNINSGTLNTDRFSAYADLIAENKLAFTDNCDLVTKGQLLQQLNVLNTRIKALENKL